MLLKVPRSVLALVEDGVICIVRVVSGLVRTSSNSGFVVFDEKYAWRVTSVLDTV